MMIFRKKSKPSLQETQELRLKAEKTQKKFDEMLERYIAELNDPGTSADRKECIRKKIRALESMIRSDHKDSLKSFNVDNGEVRDDD